jgi:hypothetical protein
MTTLFSCILLALTGAVAASAETINFDNVKPGALPPGWASAMTHNGGAPRWDVRSDDTAPSKPNVLAQLSDDRTSGRFPLAIYEKASVKDGEVSVKCKPISGRGDQACGIVWRYRDPNNYYIVRSNALEGSVAPSSETMERWLSVAARLGTRCLQSAGSLMTSLFCVFAGTSGTN